MLPTSIILLVALFDRPGSAVGASGYRVTSHRAWHGAGADEVDHWKLRSAPERSTRARKNGTMSVRAHTHGAVGSTELRRAHVHRHRDARACRQRSLHWCAIAGSRLADVRRAASRAGARGSSSTVNDDRRIHSLHAYFLRSGAPEQSLELVVERLRDGRSFSLRNVRALQNGNEVLRMIASFHVAEPGDEYAGAQMPKVPPPDAVTLTYAQHTRRKSGGAHWSGDVRPMDIRYVNPPSAPRGVPVTEDQRLWMRINEPLGDDPAIHAIELRTYPTAPWLITWCCLMDNVGRTLDCNRRASTTRCGSTGRRAPMRGCCSINEWNQPAVVAAS